jgi:hypothetical protein
MTTKADLIQDMKKNKSTNADNSSMTTITDTPRTDTEVFPIQDCNGQLRMVITTQFAKQLERELGASQEAYLKSVERDDYLTRELAECQAEVESLRSQLKRAVEIAEGLYSEDWFETWIKCEKELAALKEEIK